jgi:hypothetical protein
MVHHDDDMDTRWCALVCMVVFRGLHREIELIACYILHTP